MYSKRSFSSILIIKMSSLGDIVQAFPVLDELRLAFPEAAIDWVTEEPFLALVAAHPYVRHALPVNFKEVKKGWWLFRIWKKLFHCITCFRASSYDVLFDLQGNSKSGLVTFLSRAKLKIGLGYRSVREKPNVLFTHLRFDVSRKLNIREQYLHLVRQFLTAREIKMIDRQESPASSNANCCTSQNIKLRISDEQQKQIEQIFLHPSLQTPLRIMICPGSQWMNKQIPVPILCQFLEHLKESLPASFLLVWGSEREKNDCELVHRQFRSCSLVLEKLPIAVWQNVMHEVDIVIAVDSSALHLCGMTNTPSFSVFGPTASHIFKPMGLRHFAIQGACPYGRAFDKTCTQLRICPTGACMGNLEAKEMAAAFFSWWEKIYHFLE